MIISQIQPVRIDSPVILLTNCNEPFHKPLREVPQISSKDKAVFGYIEQKAQQMTIDDLMAKIGISDK